MVKASDLLSVGGGGVDYSTFPHSKIGNGAFYQPYPKAPSGNINTGSNDSLFFPFAINSAAKIKSLLVHIAANETRGFRYGVYEIADYMKRGAEVFSGSVADNVLSLNNNEITLASTVDIAAGWYLIGFSGLGVANNNSPAFSKIEASADQPTFVGMLPTQSSLRNSTDLARLKLDNLLSDTAENDSFQISGSGFPCFAFGMEV
jgi:hypothetical protein